MQFHTEYLTFRTTKHREYINITPRVESALSKSGIRDGMILVSAMHITAGVYVNDAEDGLIHDIDERDRPDCCVAGLCNRRRLTHL